MNSLLNIVLCTTGWVLLSSQGPRQAASAAPDLIGKWRKEAGATWEFRADNTYTVALSDGKTSVSGKYTFAGNQLTIVDQSATGMAEACAATEKGVYKFAVKDKTLEVTTVSDSCPGRSAIAPGSYKRE
jgi:hypothetical protein